MPTVRVGCSAASLLLAKRKRRLPFGEFTRVLQHFSAADALTRAAYLNVGRNQMVDVETRQRAKRIAERRGLGGMANDTKWREFFLKIAGATFPLEVKFIHEEHAFVNKSVWVPSENYIEGTGMGPELFVFIEWVRSSRVGELVAISREVGLECNVDGENAKVYGYR
jgi:hypothetical protein